MKKLFLLVLLFQSFLIAQPKVYNLEAWATDYTNTLSSQEISYLNNDLRAFSDTTTNQIIVLMLPSLNGYPIEDYAYQTVAQNKIGSKKNNNGLLLLIVKDEKKLRIEVGYGLEGAVPDAVSSSIIRNEIKPYFKRGDYFGGIKSGVNAIKAATAGEYKAASERKGTNNGKNFGSIIIFIIIIILSFIFRGRHGGGFVFYGGGSGGGSGSFGSGSGGGFSGGGGSFGGGGSSGSW
ncbi:MAG: TPM domain-containing protein [Ignavibacteria bacterium]